MAYATYEEVTTRYSILKTWGKTKTEVSSDLIYFAEVELNSKMASHFSVPFSGSHPTVKDLTIDLAYYKALLTKDPDKAEKIMKAVDGRIGKIKNGDLRPSDKVVKKLEKELGITLVEEV